MLTFIPLPLICSPNEGCFIVQNSSYARTLGISNEIFGDAIFLLMSTLITWHILKPTKLKEFGIRVGTFFGALVAIYFLYLQAFVIHAFCKYCLVVDIGMLLAITVLLLPEKKQRENPNKKIEMHIEENL
jgi:uncharacterized membrane protein